jgi:hypothetical protein
VRDGSVAPSCCCLVGREVSESLVRADSESLALAERSRSDVAVPFSRKGRSEPALLCKSTLPPSPRVGRWLLSLRIDVSYAVTKSVLAGRADAILPPTLLVSPSTGRP